MPTGIPIGFIGSALERQSLVQDLCVRKQLLKLLRREVVAASIVDIQLDQLSGLLELSQNPKALAGHAFVAIEAELFKIGEHAERLHAVVSKCIPANAEFAKRLAVFDILNLNITNHGTMNIQDLEVRQAFDVFEALLTELRLAGLNVSNRHAFEELEAGPINLLVIPNPQSVKVLHVDESLKRAVGDSRAVQIEFPHLGKIEQVLSGMIAEG